MLTRINDRLLPEALDDRRANTPTSRPLQAAARAYQRELDNLAANIGLAA